MEDRASNRRIGERLGTPDLTVTWEVPKRGRFRTKQQVEPVQMVNASASGAGLIAPRVEGIVPRSHVVLHFGNHQLRARVIRIEPTPIVGMTYYGVQLLEPTPEAVEFLLNNGGGQDRSELEGLWRRSH